MSKEEAEKIIEDYINKTRRVLPSSFETEDLLDDLRTHILDSLQDKIAQSPSEEIVVLVREVLDHLGAPEEIAKEYTEVGVADSEDSDNGKQWSRKLLRLVAAIIISVIAAVIVSYVTEGAIDFLTALITLVLFAIAEWFLRAWQIDESTRIEAKAK
ncbi:MAG: HAAS signaling domain-containing protein [Candidatus Thorarchaeota archaeon]|jgi:uncharacterized membrane protein